MTDAGRPRASMTVEAALRLPALRHGRPQVVTGSEQLDRPIRWVHPGDAPHLPSMLEGGELILTTGLALRSTESQRSFVRGVAAKGAAGLVLELGSVFQEVPKAMITTAASHDLPLIALQREIPFVSVTKAVHEAILARELAIVRAGDSFQRDLTSLVLEGNGVPELLKRVADQIGNPVLLERDGGGIAYHATFRDGDEEVLASREITNTDEPRERLEVSVEGPGGRRWGRLVGLAVDSRFDDLDRVVIERTALILAVALTSRREDELLTLRKRGNLLGALAAGRLHPDDAAARAEAIGFKFAAGALLPLALGPRVAGIPLDDEEWNAIVRSLLDEMHGSGIPAMIGLRRDEGDILALFALTSDARRIPVIENVAAVCASAANRHLADPHAVVIAAAAAVPDWDQVPDRLTEAAATLRFARRRPAKPWFEATDTDIEQWLWELRNDPGLIRFVSRRLKPLIEHDRQRASKLLPTLQTLLEHGGQKSKTARAMHLSRQALYQRLDRIEQLLTCDLARADTRLELHLALKAHSLLADLPKSQGDLDPAGRLPSIVGRER